MRGEKPALQLLLSGDAFLFLWNLQPFSQTYFKTVLPYVPNISDGVFCLFFLWPAQEQLLWWWYFPLANLVVRHSLVTMSIGAEKMRQDVLIIIYNNLYFKCFYMSSVVKLTWCYTVLPQNVTSIIPFSSPPPPPTPITISTHLPCPSRLQSTVSGFVSVALRSAVQRQGHGCLIIPCTSMQKATLDKHTLMR